MSGLPLRFFNCLEVLCSVLTDGCEKRFQTVSKRYCKNAKA